MTAPNSSTFIKRVVLKNYRSIDTCTVDLTALTFLVGPNGSGKSNFLDAIRLTKEALATTLEHALHDRGGIAEVRRRSGGHPRNFAVRLDLSLPTGEIGFFAFEVGAREAGGFAVVREQCQIGEHHYQIEDGELKQSTLALNPAAASDRLFLVAASGLPEFRPVFDGLSRMGFYSIAPEVIRIPQRPDLADVLSRDGTNLASVLGRMRRHAPEALKRVVEFLAVVVPGIEDVTDKALGPLTTIEFKQRVEGQARPWNFQAINMSDGTLRVLAILVALFQPAMKTHVQLVGIEEPETALHPAASGALIEALVSASRNTQVIVTSHSPDLLDNEKIGDENIIGVQSFDGRTELGPINDASRDVLKKRLFTAGELLRSDQLRPAARPQQLDIFDRLRVL